MWIQFWDMHSGGTRKLDWENIYVEIISTEDKIEAEKLAKLFFYNRFNRNPERVTCTCCGDDYSINCDPTLEESSGFHRNCLPIQRKSDGRTSLHKPLPEGIKYYYEEGEAPPKGFTLKKERFRGEYISLKKYITQKDVLVIYANEIKPEELIGNVPEEGYCWID